MNPGTTTLITGGSGGIGGIGRIGRERAPRSACSSARSAWSCPSTRERPAGSKYPWDHFELKSVIPAEDAFQPLSQSTCPLVKR